MYIPLKKGFQQQWITKELEVGNTGHAYRHLPSPKDSNSFSRVMNDTLIRLGWVLQCHQKVLLWGPFLERPGKSTGPVSYFEIKVSRKVGCVLASNEIHFVSLAENFTV